MNPNQLTHLLEKLYDIDKGLGGNMKKNNSNRNSNEYEYIKEETMKQLFSLQKKQNERDEKLKKFGNDRDNIATGVQIRDSIHDVERLLKNMEEVLQRQAKNPKKYPKADLEIRERLYNNFQEQLNNIKAREMGGVIGESGSAQPKIQTFTDQRNKLMANGNLQNRAVKYEMTKDEEEALQRWGQKDVEMDNQLNIIIDNNDRLKDQALMIGDKIDHTHKQIGTLNKEVDKTNQTLMTSNRKLKELIVKFRQPNKFCLDITLFLLFIGLIGVAINMYQKSKK